MTNKLVVIINSFKVPKIKKILLYEMKFLVPNYNCLQNPWLEGYRPHFHVLSVLCPQLNLLNPSPNKIPGYATVPRAVGAEETECASVRNGASLKEQQSKDRIVRHVATRRQHRDRCNCRWVCFKDRVAAFTEAVKQHVIIIAPAFMPRTWLVIEFISFQFCSLLVDWCTARGNKSQLQSYHKSKTKT